MSEWLRKLRQRWNDWCGDREMEQSIREHLSREGYYGNTAQLSNIRLVAVQRPGWVQVFRFDARARVQSEDQDEGPDEPPHYEVLFGLLRDDARQSKTRIEVVHSESERKEWFARWSEGLICLRGAQGLR